MDLPTLDDDRTSVSAAFAKDHERLDRALGTFRNLKTVDLARATIAFRAFRRDLEHHMRCEEEVLFTAIERRIGSRVGPTAVMHAEHRRILASLERLGRRVESGVVDCDEEEAALIEALETHNFKEDQILYPMIDRILDAPERRRLIDALERVAVGGNPECCA